MKEIEMRRTKKALTGSKGAGREEDRQEETKVVVVENQVRGRRKRKRWRQGGGRFGEQAGGGGGEGGRTVEGGGGGGGAGRGGGPFLKVELHLQRLFKVVDEPLEIVSSRGHLRADHAVQPSRVLRALAFLP
eukprot:347050-Hanusia_phi.AAC.2